MKPKKPDGNVDVPQHVLNKELTQARINETNRRAHIQETRDKKLKMEIATRRGELISNLAFTSARF